MPDPFDDLEIEGRLDEAARSRVILGYGRNREKLFVLRERAPAGERGPVQERLIENLRETFGDALEEREVDQPTHFLGQVLTGAGIVRDQPLDPGGPEGTLGLPLIDGDGRLYFLAAGHVLSNFWQTSTTNDAIDWFAAPGQPENLGRVHHAGKVTPLSSGSLDAGLIVARPGFSSLNRAACAFDVAPTSTKVEDETEVEKCGFRSPHRTRANVIWPKIKAVVDHLEKRYIFDNQIYIEPGSSPGFAQLGDSGSVVVTADKREFVGMLIAGSVVDGFFIVTPAAALEKYWVSKGLKRLP